MQMLSLEEIKNIELDLLMQFKDICEENHLRYTLIGGTLLGAVRHKGFIPWDDDIDVAMPRSDYEKVKDILGEDIFRGKYKYISSEFGNFYFPYSKLINIQTIVKQEYFQDSNEDSIWIDIFPIDGLPDDRRIIHNTFKKMAFWRKVLSLNYVRGFRSKNLIRSFSRLFSIPFSKCIGPKRCLKVMDNISKRYSFEESPIAAILSWGLYGEGEANPKEVFRFEDTMWFENEEFSVITGWHQYLSGVYGDYMKLPPVEKRKNHEITAYTK